MREICLQDIVEIKRILDSFIARCKNLLPKFNDGTPQKTLLLNRIKALEISKMSLTADIPSDCFKLQELCDSVAPIVSIIKKCQKSQSKFDKENVWHKRFANIIYAMEISLSSISTQIEKMKRNQHAF